MVVEHLGVVTGEVFVKYFVEKEILGLETGDNRKEIQDKQNPTYKHLEGFVRLDNGVSIRSYMLKDCFDTYLTSRYVFKSSKGEEQLVYTHEDFLRLGAELLAVDLYLNLDRVMQKLGD